MGAKKKTFKPWKQGLYKPLNKKKCKNTVTPVYRSSWELKLFRWMDLNPNVIAWTSEKVIVPYENPVTGRVSRYYPDATMHIKEGDKVIKYLIEVKPECETKPPVFSKRKKPKTVLYERVTWAKNQCKWKAARQYSARNGYKFIILTEKHLNIR